MLLLAWSPLAGGFLAIEEQRPEREGVAVYDHAANRLRRSRAIALARERGVESAVIALAWILGEGPTSIRSWAALGPTAASARPLRSHPQSFGCEQRASNDRA